MGFELQFGDPADKYKKRIADLEHELATLKRGEG